MISVLELFSIGIGPSSSHTMGPMRAARTYVEELRERALLTQVHRIRVDLYGSLGATGRGHGSDKAVILGLLGDRPETVNPDTVDDRIDVVATSGILSLGGYIDIAFRPSRDITLHLRKSLAVHPNGMAFAAMDKSGELLHARTFYSVGGGFVVSENDLAHPTSTTRPDVPFPFSTAGELLAICTRNNLPISEVVRRNELAHRSEEDLLEQLLGIWAVNLAAPTISTAPSADAMTQGGPGGAGPGGGGFAAMLSPEASAEIVLQAPVTLWVVAAAIGLAVAGGLIAGAFGGWRAARLSPAEALRSVG